MSVSKPNRRATSEPITSSCAATIEKPDHITNRFFRSQYMSGRFVTRDFNSSVFASDIFASECNRKRLLSLEPTASSAPGR